MSETKFNLEEVVKAVVKNYQETEYFWPPRNKKINYKKFGFNELGEALLKRKQNEAQNVNLFAEYSEKFEGKDFKNDAKKTFDLLHDEGQRVIFDILQWGGTFDRDNGEKNNNDGKKKGPDIRKAVINISNNLADIEEYMDKDLQDPEIIKKIASRMQQNKVGIASWSKILAAYKPGTFFIYDSRVAIALSSITLKSESKLPCFWNIPNYFIAKRDKDAIGKMNQAIDTYREKTPNSEIADFPTCYALYLKLLRKLSEDKKIRNDYKKCNDDVLNEDIRKAYNNAGFSEDQAIMAHLEKMLFMMKEGIVDDIKKGKWL